MAIFSPDIFGQVGHLRLGWTSSAKLEIVGQVGNLRLGWRSSGKLAIFGRVGNLRPSWTSSAELDIFGRVGHLRPSWTSVKEHEPSGFFLRLAPRSLKIKIRRSMGIGPAQVVAVFRPRAVPMRSSLLGCLLCLAGNAATAGAADAVDYLKDVRPILAKHCYECHGPDVQKSGLRLDTVAAAEEGGYNGAA